MPHDECQTQELFGELFTFIKTLPNAVESGYSLLFLTIMLFHNSQSILVISIIIKPFDKCIL